MSAEFVQGISELALWVSDVERAASFYRDALGFELLDIDPGRNAFLRSGTVLLALFNPTNPGTPLAEAYIARTGGPVGQIYHMGLLVDPEQLDTQSGRLKAEGYDVKGPHIFASGRRSWFLEDPDGHLIELTDR
jgi:catechol 2,3-dioxygenase-like lactoylglutathione lyase family enzyme